MTIVLLAVVAAAFAIAPYFAIRGELRRPYAMLDAGAWAATAAGAALVPLLGIALAPGLWLGLFIAARAALLFGFLLAHADDGDVRWTPDVAAFLAGAVFVVIGLHSLQWPIDGDEPFYVLVTESIVRDRDFDLRNQYAELAASATGRTELEPQLGDPVGPRGEQYSRHEPFLALLMVPGYLAGGLHGAMLTIVLFGVLFVRSLMKLLEEEGFTQRTLLAIFPLVALAPPVLSYATRIWPEIPAAFFLTEALRAARRGRPLPLLASLAALGLLKLRFLLIAVAFAATWFARERRWKLALIAMPLFLVPLAIVWAIAGQPLNVHSAGELAILDPGAYVRGFFGLLVDGQAGLLFHAPALFLGLFALLRLRTAPSSFRLGAIAAAPYLLLLFPRAEWHGGWAPPLRYVAVFTPVLALGMATLLEKMKSRKPFDWAATATVALSVYAIAFPWRLFHIANGESALGEMLSARYGADFSRMIPSLIRPNFAAVAASVVIVVAGALIAIALRRGWKWPDFSAPAAGALAALIVAAGFTLAMRPGRIVHFEDAHVAHRGGELYPKKYTVARFLYTAGWRLRRGESVEFLHAGGASTVRYHAHGPVTLRTSSGDVTLPSTHDRFVEARITLGPAGTQKIECVDGEIVLEKIETGAPR